MCAIKLQSIPGLRGKKETFGNLCNNICHALRYASFELFAKETAKRLRASLFCQIFKRSCGMGVCTLSRCGEDWNAAWNWKCDKRSAVTLCFPGICFARKWILYESVAKTKRLIKRIIELSFDVCLFMIWTTAMLSNINMTFLSLIFLPQISMAKTMGKSSFTAIWYLTRSSSQDEANH